MSQKFKASYILDKKELIYLSFALGYQKILANIFEKDAEDEILKSLAKKEMVRVEKKDITVEPAISIVVKAVYLGELMPDFSKDGMSAFLFNKILFLAEEYKNKNDSLRITIFKNELELVRYLEDVTE